MERGLRIVLATMAIGATMLALLPFVSVWRLSNEVLEFLPEDDRIISTQVSSLALFDRDDFVLATAHYQDATEADVVEQLTTAGFSSGYVSEHDVAWLWHTCCGDYDAALARPVVTDQGVTVYLSVFDSDIVASWPLITGFGLIVAFASLIGLKRLGQSPSGEPATEKLRSSLTGADL